MTRPKRTESWWVTCEEGSIGPYISRKAAEEAIASFRCELPHTIENLVHVKTKGTSKSARYYTNEEMSRFT